MKGLIDRLLGRRNVATMVAEESEDWAENSEAGQVLKRSGRSRWLGLPMAVILGATIAWTAKPAPEQQQIDAREHYYRGVYDVCRGVMQYTEEMCVEAVRVTIKHRWYEDPTPGWAWPMFEELQAPDSRQMQHGVPDRLAQASSR